jgi:hypothetical protein
LVKPAFEVAAAVAPGPEFLGDPGGQPGRGVGQRGGEGLRAGGLQVGVTALGVPPPLLPVQERLALGGDGLPGGRDGDHAGQVEAGHHAGVGGGQGDADRRADVLALGAEPLVAESLGHQRGP